MGEFELTGPYDSSKIHPYGGSNIRKVEWFLSDNQCPLTVGDSRFHNLGTITQWRDGKFSTKTSAMVLSENFDTLEVALIVLRAWLFAERDRNVTLFDPFAYGRREEKESSTFAALTAKVLP
jgi:hypothetical protein